MKRSEFATLKEMYNFKKYFRKSGGVGLATVTMFSDYSRATVDRNLRVLANMGFVDVEIITSKSKDVRLFSISDLGIEFLEDSPF